METEPKAADHQPAPPAADAEEKTLVKDEGDNPVSPQGQAEEEHEEGLVIGAGIDFADPNSPLAPLYMRTSHIVAAFFLAALFVVLSYWPGGVWYTDIWAHLKFGQYIVTEGKLPEHEKFSGKYAEDKPYINYQWLAQAGEYLLFDFGRSLAAAPQDTQDKNKPVEPEDLRLGAGAALLATSLAVARTLQFLLLMLAFRRLTNSMASAVGGAALVLFLSLFTSLFIVRPQMFGDLAFAGLLFLLSRPMLSWRAVAAGIVVMVLWANFHGSFAVGLTLLGLFWAGRALTLVVPGVGGTIQDAEAPALSLQERLRAWPRALFQDPQFCRLSVLLVGSLAGVMVNPHGPALLWYTWDLSQNANIQTLWEWQSHLDSPGGIVFLLSALALLPLLKYSPQRWTPTQLVLLAFFGIQTALHYRMLNWWAMVYPWVVLPHLLAVYQRYRPVPAGELAPPDLRKTILVAVVALVVIFCSPPVQLFMGKEASPGSAVVNRLTPLEVSKRLKEDPSLLPIFTSETLGDYLFWDLPSNPKEPTVFCYTHVHLFTPQHWQETLTVKFAQPGWKEIVNQRGIQSLAVEMSRYGDLIDQVEADKEHWQVIPLKETGIFFARRKKQ
jgi:hypothetical protein